jgi:ABC-type phosphate transport system ATPase subunit
MEESIQSEEKLKTSENGLIGPSGGGKSTFVRILNRMSDPLPHTHIEGEALLDGEHIFGDPVDIVTLRRRVGMVFQQPDLLRISLMACAPRANISTSE